MGKLSKEWMCILLFGFFDGYFELMKRFILEFFIVIFFFVMLIFFLLLKFNDMNLF